MERVKAAVVKIQCSTVEQVATAKENINSTDDLNDGSIHGIISELKVILAHFPELYCSRLGADLRTILWQSLMLFFVADLG